ncbi:TIGR02680 family protein [Kribbella sp. NPDC026611]|uniref:TIGR02680 family protein n=1 Tax=Kribbella sp. NPDC026611 TaxID=3154911 RepID=UPI0033D2739F
MPARAGILNVWRYYDEVFTFHDGRLLLRGPNGSGKSKALELLLPFLFDANLRANRLSTFGTGERTMHWNLMGEGASGTTRVGYVWLEFSSSERDTWFTCGARLQAAAHTTTVHPEYFTTDLRIGPDGLSLVNDLGMPLTTSALAERLGEHGAVHGSAAAYRSTIRTTLFPGLTEQRYDALIMALLQLRTPKLSQRLDPALLSTLLSRALPPLDSQEIADLAEGFERLDAQRERLRTLEAEVDAAGELARLQRGYAQRILRASAGKLIGATTELERLSGEVKATADEHEKANARDSQLDAKLTELAGEARRTQARQEGLTDSDMYRAGRELDSLRWQTEDARVAAERTARLATRAAGQASDDQRDLNAALQSIQQAESAVQRHGNEVRQAATRADLLAITDELVSSATTDARQAKTLLRAIVRSREDAIREVGSAVDSHEGAVVRRQDAEQELDTGRGELDQARLELDEATEERGQALAELASRLVVWARQCQELVFESPEALEYHVESEAALRDAISTAATAVTSDVAARKATAEAGLEALEETRRTLDGQLDELNVGALTPRPPPYRTADRSTAPGAALWQLVDFAASVPADIRPRLEAALQASSLLDSWITPAGDAWLQHRSSPDGQGYWLRPSHDTFADPAGLAPVAGRSLADVLTPEPDGPVSEDAVRRLLAVVAVGEQLPADATAAIGLDGTWRMGALTGSWDKESPEHIGATARQQARARRAAEIRTQLADNAAQIDTQLAQLNALDHRLEVLYAELASNPTYERVDEAGRALTQLQAEVNAAEGVVRGRVQTVQRREGEVSAALRSLTSLASEAQLPTQRSALADVETALHSFADLADSWLDAQAELNSTRDKAGALKTRADRSTDDAEQRAGEAAEAAAAHEAIAVRLETVENSVGRDYRELLDVIAELRTRLQQVRAEEESARILKNEVARTIGELSSRLETAKEAHEQGTAARDAAAAGFRKLASGTFPADSNLPNLAAFEDVLASSDGVRAALDAARLVGAAWLNLPHAPNHLADAVRRLSEKVHECRESLRSRADLDLETHDDVQVFTAIVDGLRVGAAELLRILRRDAEQSRAEITDQERELFDRTLTGNTRRHLANRIRQANELVDLMNTRLEQVRTASKVAVQLVWQTAPDLAAGTRTARDLLLKDPAQLSDDDRESLHRFLRDRVEQARANDTATTWAEQLTQVFDYTAWHHFVVKVDRGKGDGWQPLTRKLHGALSGGEKAIALHLPLFAVVAAHYQSVPTAPRVILLDEVFVGVDTTNRGQVFALLAALDLDLMLTSDHEWCTYAELPGIGIHQLLTAADGDGDDAVTTARFTWNGHELTSQDTTP